MTPPAAQPAGTSLEELVGRHVADGQTIFVGGFAQNIPFAIGLELLRQGRRGLHLCRTGADVLCDLLVAGGAVQRLTCGWIGNPGVGSAHAFRRALAAGRLEFEETSNFALLLRLQAAALGLPFMPTRTLLAGALAGSGGARPIECPLSGAPLMAVPALVPDVAIVHAQRADTQGNLQMWGLLGDTVEGALAARKVIATVEQIVGDDEVRATPEATRIPAWRVAGLALAPGGALPSYCDGYYGRDDRFYLDYDRLARDAGALDAWLAARLEDGDLCAGREPALRAKRRRIAVLEPAQ